MTHHFYETCAYFTAARYMRTVEGLANQYFQPTGLKPAYAYIMMALEDQHPLAVTTLADRLGYERSSVYRMVQRLATKGLVKMYADGKAAQVELLPASRDFLIIANQCLERWGQFTTAQLGPDKLAMVQLLTSNNQKLRSVSK